jgi:hypothetical protein
MSQDVIGGGYNMSDQYVSDDPWEATKRLKSKEALPFDGGKSLTPLCPECKSAGFATKTGTRANGETFIGCEFCCNEDV